MKNIEANYESHDKELLARDIIGIVENWLHDPNIWLHIKGLVLDKLQNYYVKLNKYEEESKTTKSENPRNLKRERGNSGRGGGKTRRLFVTKMQFRQILEMVYLLNGNKLVVVEGELPEVLLLPLTDK